MNRAASRFPWIASGMVFVPGFLYLATLGNGRTFALDEWSWVADRRSFSADTLFTPHNGNLHALPVAVFVLVFRTIGLDHPEVFRLLVLVSHVGVAVCVGELVRRRHGPLGGACAGSMVVLLGAASGNILWGFQIGMVWSVLFFLIVVILVDSWVARPGVLLSLSAAGALALSVLSSSVGVCACIATVWLVAFSRDRRGLWWAPFPGIAAYGSWFVTYREPIYTLTDPSHILRWCWRSLSGTLAAFFSLPFAGGVLMVLALGAMTVVAVLRRGLTSRSLVWVPFVGSFWVFTGVARWFDSPTASRYLYVSMIALVLFFAEVLPSPLASSPRRLAMATVLVVSATILSVVVQFPGFEDRDREMRSFMFAGGTMRGSLAAAELLRPVVAGEQALAWFGDAPLMTARDYFAAIDEIGDSPAYPYRRLPSAPPSVRQGADGFLNRAGLARFDPIVGGTCGTWSALTGTIDVPGGGSVVVKSDQPNGLIVRRFYTEDWSVTNWRDVAAGEMRISVPRDALEPPWRVHFLAAVRVAICSQ